MDAVKELIKTAHAYFIGKYDPSDDDFMSDIKKGDLVVCLEPTKENMELAKQLFNNHS